MITSRQNPKIQFVHSLMGRPKERQEARAFPAEGLRLVEEGIMAGWKPQIALYANSLSERGRGLLQKIQLAGVETEEVRADLMQYLSDTENTQGILAVFSIREPSLPEAFDFLLAIDAIRDPGNLGTLLRTAVAAGVQGVAILPTSTDPYAPKVVRSAMGAHFKLPMLSVDWEGFRKLTHPGDPQRQMSVLLAEASEGKAYWEENFRKPLALIISNEAEGATELAKQAADRTVRIPMPGHFESLNAAAAGAILMFEVVRQRSSQGDKL
jgi:TrmH family RNA methyltransferase